MTLCFVNQFHRFHFELISKDFTFEELGSIVHGTELFDSTLLHTLFSFKSIN